MIPPSPVITAALLVALVPVSAAAERPAPAPEPPTPALIEAAVASGDLGRHEADRYLLAALRGEDLPERYESRTPFDGTMPLLELERRLDRLPPGEHRRYLANELHPVGGVGTDDCGGIGTPMPSTVETTHYYIEYNAATIGGGLTIDDYVAALETAWVKEVDQFGWAAPPPYPPNPAPNNKYPVRVVSLGPTVYGFVANSGTHAGLVGNNPATAWNEGDAFATCMVINSNFDPFPGAPIQALQATAAHEFNHSIQFGWGALSGGAPDSSFVEGAATWMEDEVFDESNDNYNFLWPQFEDDMGQYIDSPLESPYEYWITFRGLTEPHGVGVPGGGEDIMQRFWERTSRNERFMLEALDAALQTRGTSLSNAYHAYAIAVKFNKPCGGGYQPPHCLEEGPAYVAAAGPTAVHGSVAMNSTFVGGVLDNYSLHWIQLPQSTSMQVALRNTSAGGRLRASVACDTGTGFVIQPFTDVAGAGESVFVREYNGAACASPVAVVTNVTQTSANPASSELRSYSLTVTPPARPSNLSVRGRLSGRRVIARGSLDPADGGEAVELSLLRKAKGWKEVQGRTAKVTANGSFRVRFRSPDATRCRVEAEFEGSITLRPSSARKTFRC